MITPVSNSALPTYRRTDLPDLMQSEQWNLLPPEGAGIEMFSPTFDLHNSDLFASSSAIDVMQDDLAHGFIDIGGWEGSMSFP